MWCGFEEKVKSDGCLIEVQMVLARCMQVVVRWREM